MALVWRWAVFPGQRGVAFVAIALLMLASQVSLAPAVMAQSNPNVITLYEGNAALVQMQACPLSGAMATAIGGSATVSADVTGSAAGWVQPKHIEFGDIPYGECNMKEFTIEVPWDADPGSYSIIWTFTCQSSLGQCSVMTNNEYTVQVVWGRYAIGFMANIPATIDVDGAPHTTPFLLWRDAGIQIQYTFLDRTVYNGVIYVLTTTPASGTITVTGDQTIRATYVPLATTTTTTTQTSTQSSSTQQTTSQGQGGCPPGEIQGGLPGSPICYPPGMQVVESGGDTSVVDLSGSPSQHFVPGNIASTGSNSMVSASYQGFAGDVGQDTTVAWVPLAVNGDGTLTSYEDTSTFYTSFEGLATNFEGQLGSAALTHLALEHILLLAGAGAFSFSVIPPAFAMFEVAHGELHILETDLGNAATAVNCLATADLAGCPTGTEYVVSVLDNGTTLSVLSGTFAVSTFFSNSTLVVRAGQSLFVPRTGTSSPAVSSIDTNTLSHWWASAGQGAVPDYQTIAILATGFVIIVVAGGVLASRSRRTRGRAKAGAGTTARQPDLRTCQSCGERNPGSNAYCSNCGKKL